MGDGRAAAPVEPCERGWTTRPDEARAAPRGRSAGPLRGAGAPVGRYVSPAARAVPALSQARRVASASESKIRGLPAMAGS